MTTQMTSTAEERRMLAQAKYLQVQQKLHNLEQEILTLTSTTDDGGRRDWWGEAINELFGNEYFQQLLHARINSGGHHYHR